MTFVHVLLTMLLITELATFITLVMVYRLLKFTYKLLTMAKVMEVENSVINNTVSKTWTNAKPLNSTFGSIWSKVKVVTTL